MKRILLFFALITGFSLQVYSMPHYEDLFVYKGDTLRILPPDIHLLKDHYPGYLLVRSKILKDKPDNCFIDVACWTVIQEELYLTGLLCENYHSNKQAGDLKELFGDKYKDGKVKADWFTGNILIPQGKYLVYEPASEYVIYEKELDFQFKDGILVKTTEYDNSGTKRLIYRTNEQQLGKWIYSHIDWEKLPELNDNIKVTLRFSANENGIIDEVTVLKSYNELFDNEAVRVIKSIPEWEALFIHGKLRRIPWNMVVVFNEKMKEKYAIN